MNDEILRHYGLTDPFAEQWQDIDSSSSAPALSVNEPDALGTGINVSSVLYDRGILRSDSGVPPEYSLNSRTFDAKAYVRNVHRKATQADLLRGQDYLNTAIESKAGSLRILVEDNFDRFVSSKRVIDDVHSQITSEFGQTNGQDISRMEALKASLNDTSIKATQVFEPVIDNRRKADRVRATLGILEQYSAHFDLPSNLLRCIESHDNDALLRAYKKGQAIFKDVIKGNSTTDRRNARVLGRVWNEVMRIMRNHEMNVWRLLEEQSQIDIEATAKLANFLLELGVDSNPYHRAYIQHNLRVKESASKALERARTRVEILRRQLLLKHVHTKEDSIHALTVFVDAENSPSETTSNIIQSPEVLAFWDSVKLLVNDVWIQPIADLCENWKIVQDMTNTRSVKLLPNGPEGASRKYHSFTIHEREVAITKAEETVVLLGDSLIEFFMSKPLKELPAIYSPTSPEESSSTRLDLDDAPVLPDLGDRELGEFSFISVSVNSLGACTNLTAILTTIMSGVQQLHGLKISAKADESLQKVMTTIRERMIRAICELWQTDSDDLPFLESWKRSMSTKGTDFSKTFWITQKAIIDGLAKIMFRNELSPAPSQRLINNVRQQFVKNVYQVINGLMTLTYAPPTTNSALQPTVDVEVKKLFTIVNLQTIQSSTLIQLVQILESTFSTSLTPDLQKINTMFTQYIQKLTSSFLSPRQLVLDRTIEQDVEGTDWSTVPFPEDISQWTNKVVLGCITAHATISSHTPVLLPSLLESLTTHFLKTHQTLLVSSIDHGISVGGAIQVSLDLEFITIQFSDALSGSAKAIMDETHRLVDGQTDRALPVTGDRTDVKRVLGRAARRWSAHASVFKNPPQASEGRR
ncbi:putative Exocyst complex component Sec5 [Taphrina deformans PYCC 5710]|uniref:Exocyst complex component SEC5 n=1 Tax=Taphrina deformans (strain PYCC 5710 / ATCC 11124 / CBS 356.35 / IMI 108563 / JCM 9778 / NBRC 8474) TaxID=1097556 RepID=R4XBF6_TAPDE|nr:putative Exocyst complex component Sec5 [Taphrina deformans PYCC 5710]|eukprot:CCG82930.1 putative Exocyst complex component Sec5 [Taphrina deformans PYCC 5710]